MPIRTFNWDGVGLPVQPDINAQVPLRARIWYAWHTLLGRVRIVGTTDVSRVKSDGIIEARIVVFLTPEEAERYPIYDDGQPHRMKTRD